MAIILSEAKRGLRMEAWKVNQEPAVANRFSQGRFNPKWQRQDQSHSTWNQGRNLTNHNMNWNQRAEASHGNTFSSQYKNMNNNQLNTKPQCSTCQKFHHGVCRYKGQPKCGRCNLFGHNTNDCNDYKQLANCAQEEEEVSNANLFYACHVASIKDKVSPTDIEEGGGNVETNEDHAEQQIEVMHDGVVEEGSFEKTSDLRAETSEETSKYVSEVHEHEVLAESEHAEIEKEKHTEVAVTDLVAWENQNKKTIDATEVVHDELKNKELANQDKQQFKEGKEDTENCKPINLGEETTKESHQIYDLKAEKSHKDKMENEIQNEEVSNESREYLHSAAAENETIKESFLDEAGSEMHFENQIHGTTSATKTTKNTCSQKEETKEQEECGSGVECNIDMQKNGSYKFDEKSQAEATLLLCDNVSAISMARNPD